MKLVCHEYWLVSFSKNWLGPECIAAECKFSRIARLWINDMSRTDDIKPPFKPCENPLKSTTVPARTNYRLEWHTFLDQIAEPIAPFQTLQ